MATNQVSSSLKTSKLSMRGKMGKLACILTLGIAISGCAFNLVHVRQQPASFVEAMGDAGAPRFILAENTSVGIGTGFRVKLKAGTRWRQVGVIKQGDVFATNDQVLVVEASHIHESWLVVNNGFVIGFFLRVEKTFCPASKPIALILK